MKFLKFLYIYYPFKTLAATKISSEIRIKEFEYKIVKKLEKVLSTENRLT